MPDETEQDALSKIKAYLDAGHSFDAIRQAGWASWIDHLEAKGYDLRTGQLALRPPEGLSRQRSAPSLDQSARSPTQALRSSRRWQIATAVVAVVVVAGVLLGLVFGSGGGGDAGESRHRLGELAEVDDWPDVIAVELVRDIERRDLFESDTIFVVEPAEPNEEVILVRVRLINDEDEPFVIDPFFMFTLMSQNKEIELTYELFSDVVMEDQTIPPNGEIEGDLAYTIARGLRELQLVYQPGAGEAFEGFFEQLAEGDFSKIDVRRAIIALE